MTVHPIQHEEMSDVLEWLAYLTTKQEIIELARKFLTEEELQRVDYLDTDGHSESNDEGGSYQIVTSVDFYDKDKKSIFRLNTESLNNNELEHDGLSLEERKERWVRYLSNTNKFFGSKEKYLEIINSVTDVDDERLDELEFTDDIYDDMASVEFGRHSIYEVFKMNKTAKYNIFVEKL